MSIKIVPISAYDFDYLKTFVKNNYGVDISPAAFDINVETYENPKCGNCGVVIRDAYKDKKPRYCIICGAEILWSKYHIKGGKKNE